ncbi:MAG: DUF2807 domain-containing protein [Pelobium sp.]
MKNLKTRMVTALYVGLFILIMVSGTQKLNAAETKNYVMVELKESAPIDKIYAKGNVEVFISQGEEQSIKVYDNYYGKNALTQIENGTLRISSFESKKLSVWITIKNLKSIEAYDHALVYGVNKLNLLDLNVTLENQAVANLNLSAYQLTTNISDSSKLILKGDTEFHQINAHQDSNIDISKFTASNENVQLKDHASITLGQSQSFKGMEAKYIIPTDDLLFDLQVIQ